MNSGHIHPLARKLIRFHSKKDTIPQWADKIKSGHTTALAQGITLIESNKSEDRLLAIQLLKACNPVSTKTTRIGITGPPGVGKSSFIESFGILILKESPTKIAVLSVDPSSPVQGGSILGDKTRMQTLSVHERVFIRPTPSGKEQGGLHLRTRESIQLCEYAGYDYIMVETVGTGQSSFSVNDITDLTVLLIPPGGGDDLQGIKRGSTELADLIVINKDDSGMEMQAKATQNQYQQAMRLYPDKTINVMRTSALECKGIKEIVLELRRMMEINKKTKAWTIKRKKQIHKALEHKIRAVWLQESEIHRNNKTLKSIESLATRHEFTLDEIATRYIYRLKKIIK